MEISPISLFRLLCAGFLLGIFWGALHDVNRIVRVVWGERIISDRIRSFYERPLPLLQKSLPIPKKSNVKQGVFCGIIFFQDLLWCLAGAVGFVLTLYFYNSGRFRWFCLLAMIVGFLVYECTVGRLVMLCAEWIVFLLHAIFWIVWEIISKPFVCIWRFFVKKLKKIQVFFSNLIAKNTKKMYNKRRTKDLMSRADKGFLDG